MLRGELVEVHRAMREVADAFTAKKKNLEESTGLSLHLAQLSAMPTFPGDPVALAYRCISTAMMCLERAHMEEGRRFKVLKDKHDDSIYQ